jgi:hypothetical protein
MSRNMQAKEREHFQKLYVRYLERLFNHLQKFRFNNKLEYERRQNYACLSMDSKSGAPTVHRPLRHSGKRCAQYVQD